MDRGTGSTTKVFLNPISWHKTLTNEAQAQIIATAAITLTKMRVRLVFVLGSSQTWTVTLRKNGVDTALTITSTAGVLFGDITGQSVAIAKGDLVSFSYQQSGTTTANSGLAVAAYV
jgi:hypothetical protein